MRIGIMLRAFGEQGGVGLYTQKIVRHLLELDRRNEYFLYFSSPEYLETFAAFENATATVIRGGNKALWDQIAIPRACRRDRIELIFHPKFTAPLLARCPVVMVVHGADWLFPEQAQYYGRLDVAYMRVFLPLYIRKCAAVISVSQLTTDNFYEALEIEPGKMRTIYPAPSPIFRRVDDPKALQEVQDKYNLPERFLLTLTKRKGGKRKNMGQVFAAYSVYHRRATAPARLVIGGKDCHFFRQDYGLPVDGYGEDILFPGWIDHRDLPAVYTLAQAYLYPSNLEAFPMPLAEAMACGTPAITSDANGLKEIAGDAALFVDPQDEQAIAAAIEQLLGSSDLQTDLRDRGLARARAFSWPQCARQTLSVLEEVGAEPRRS